MAQANFNCANNVLHGCPAFVSITQAFGTLHHPWPHAACDEAACGDAGSFTSGIAALVEKMRYVLYAKHRRTTIDASAGASCGA